MDEKARALAVVEALKDAYPGAECTLDYDDAWTARATVRRRFFWARDAVGWRMSLILRRA